MSDHIADANKMVDTPRMNSVAGHARGIVDAAILAEGMKLERELNAANDRIKRLEDGDAALTYSIGLDLQKENEALKARIKRLEEAEQWIPASTKPEGYERRVLLWIVWPQMRGWCDSPEPLIGWWKHGPQCFALGDIENADHLVRYWMEIPDPTEAKEAKP